MKQYLKQRKEKRSMIIYTYIFTLKMMPIKYIIIFQLYLEVVVIYDNRIMIKEMRDIIVKEKRCIAINS